MAEGHTGIGDFFLKRLFSTLMRSEMQKPRKPEV